jgi:hypothetical protein
VATESTRLTDVSPPRFADAVLRLLLDPDDRESVSGDLLEEYRESILPVRGRLRADLWFVTEVLGFLWRNTRVLALVLGTSMIARTAVDWFAPTTEFHLRSAVSTWLSVGILVTAGMLAAWRGRSIAAGALAGAATTFMAAVMSTLGSASLVAIWHDPQTLAAIRGSGGLAEALTLPLTMVVVGAGLGTLGGLIADSARRLAQRVL